MKVAFTKKLRADKIRERIFYLPISSLKSWRLKSQNSRCFTLTLNFGTLREEHRSMVSENGVLWRILRSTREELTLGWKQLLNDCTFTRYCGGQMKEVDIDGPCSTHGELSVAFRITARKVEGEKKLERYSCRGEDNEYIYLGENGVKFLV
jgi:hypothetical protein